MVGARGHPTHVAGVVSSISNEIAGAENLENCSSHSDSAASCAAQAMMTQREAIPSQSSSPVSEAALSDLEPVASNDGWRGKSALQSASGTEDDQLVWKITERHDAQEFGIFRIRQHRARHPLLDRFKVFTVLESSPWVNVLALTPEGNVVMVRQFRHGIERVTCEIPGGLVEVGESGLEAGVRELLEETGYGARIWKRLGVVHANPAIQNNSCELFLAIDAVRVAEPTPDDGETIEVVEVPLDDVRRKIHLGEISHSLVISSFFFFVEFAGGWSVPKVTLE